MPRRFLLALAALLCAAALAGCSGDDGADVARPASVPGSADLVKESVEFGAPSAAAGAPREEQVLFTTTSCADDVLVVETTKQTVYAELPCDRAVPQSAAERFAGQPVRIRVVPGAQNKLYVESSAGGTLEFTPGHVWVDEK